MHVFKECTAFHLYMYLPRTFLGSLLFDQWRLLHVHNTNRLTWLKWGPGAGPGHDAQVKGQAGPHPKQQKGRLSL